MVAHPLDERAFVLRGDPKGMYNLTCDFPAQCSRALDIAKEFCPDPPGDWPDVVVLAGMGGSAAGGDFVRAIFEESGRCPFVVHRDYFVPAFVDMGSVVFVCSYSGNTEETISAYEDARSKGAHLVVVTSGGELSERAERDGVPIVMIPGGQPPRTALGYMTIPVLYACESWGLVPAQDYAETFEVLERGVLSWEVAAPFADNPAKRLAQVLHGAVGVFYGLGPWQGVVASRWKAQVEENAKRIAFSHTFPELNHNEILGWMGAARQGVGRWVVAILEDGRESPKMRARARVTADLISATAEVHRVSGFGHSLLARMWSLALLGDFVSLYLAALEGVDPENIEWIEKLKAELASVKG